jgi:hypothetical protein
MDKRIAAVDLRGEELVLLCDALDSHEYWQLGRELPRNDGSVFIPGDFVGEPDPYWNGRAPTNDEQAAIDRIREVRTLLRRLEELR